MQGKVNSASVWRINLKIWLGILLIVLLMSGITIGVERHVPSQYPNIQAAIDAAVYGDIIIVAPRTYYENITLKDGVQVHGAGADVTTIDSGRTGSVVTAIGVGPDTVLDGFTITNGSGTISPLGRLSGGGIYLENSSPVITNNVVTQNRLAEPPGYWGGNGGGIFAYFSSATIAHNTISNNSAENGGGICVDNWPNRIGPMPDIKHNNISGNNSQAGGGIYLQFSSPTVRYNTIAVNTADAGGGIAANYSSSLIANNIIASNIAGNYGGGGILAANNSSPVIVNNTVVDNTASGPGNGIAVDIYQFSLNITNCIVWGNNLYNCTATYSDIEGLQTGTGNINADPHFVNPGIGDYHLLPNSPCINMGTNTPTGGLPETDIDGELRVMLGRVDMGADEFNPLKVSLVVIPSQLEPKILLGRRISRTVFEYDCKINISNRWDSALKNIQLELAKVPSNMEIVDADISFANTELEPGGALTSLDTCTFQVDRSQPIDSNEIAWWVTCEIVATGQAIRLKVSSVFCMEPEKIDGEGKVDLAELIEKWLWTGEAGSIKEDITGDGIVNLADFAALSRHRLE